MSSTPNPRAQAAPPRPGAPSAGGGAQSFDPIKLLQKYKFILVFAVFAGGVIGVAAHFFFLSFYPKFRSSVLFECSPVQTDISVANIEKIDEDEMARFIGTQVETIKGERIRSEILNDPRLATEAPSWYSEYETRGRFDVVEAYEDIEKIIRANAIPNSYLIELSVSVNDKEDAAGLVRLVRENYLRILSSGNSSSSTKHKEQLRKSISDADTRVTELMNRRNRLLEEMNMNTADTQDSAEAVMLRDINAQILVLEQQTEAYQIILKNDESQLKKETSIVYDATLRMQVEQFPQILNLKQRIIDLEAALITYELDGIGREHRSYKTASKTLDATKRQLETTREQLLLETFESRINSSRTVLSQLRAQIEELVAQREGLLDRLNDLAQMSEEIQEINRQIENTLEQKAEREADLAKLNVTTALETANRIKVVKLENVPDRPSFPNIYIMIPAGVFLTTAFVAGALVVFEMLDQRVKSPADIAMIPRTPILGMIPDADEDPVKHDSLATLFSDAPNSVLAEHFRQLRTRVMKKMTEHDHRTLLVVGAMPGSGATNVTTNLALAIHASGKKVLIIDTNFRRARIHNAFGLAEAPGLAEVLAGEQSLADAIQAHPSGLNILPAGSRNKRVVERLGTDMMGQILAQASSEYDAIILDVAPAIVAGDAQTLTTQVDATILVARAMQEKRGQIARLKNELSDTRAEFLGVLVNGVKSAAGGYMRKNIRTSHKYHAEETPQAV
jgi:capsular exopolysaccharide synthesis family protein